MDLWRKMLIASAKVIPRLEKTDSAPALISGLARMLMVAVFAVEISNHVMHCMVNV